MTAWERVETARDSKRPTSLDYIETVFEEFMELHGDRAFRDDGAIVGGLAVLDGQPVTVIGVQTVSYTHLDVYKRQHQRSQHRIRAVAVKV